MTRGESTRERLLDAAEQLFGDHGVGNVSLRQIRLAAGQGNAASVQYHFGDRDGIIAAIAARHAPRVLELQIRHVDAAGVDGPDGPGAPTAADLRPLVGALVRPLAEYLATGPSGRAWVKIAAELVGNPRISIDTLQARTERDARDTYELGARLWARLCHAMPAEIASERVFATYLFALHACAVRARILDDPEAQRTLTSPEAFAENLVDMCTGALTAVPHAVDDRTGAPAPLPGNS